MKVRALVIASPACLIPATASACWDGLAAGGDGVSISLWQDASWNPARARQMAVWVTRLEAIVPADTSIEIMNGSLSCGGAGCPDGAFLEVRPGDLAHAFDAAAKLFGTPRAAAARAKSLPSSLFTVQVFAGAEPGARGARDRVPCPARRARAGSLGLLHRGRLPGDSPGRPHPSRSRGRPGAVPGRGRSAPFAGARGDGGPGASCPRRRCVRAGDAGRRDLRRARLVLRRGLTGYPDRVSGGSSFRGRALTATLALAVLAACKDDQDDGAGARPAPPARRPGRAALVKARLRPRAGEMPSPGSRSRPGPTAICTTCGSPVTAPSWRSVLPARSCATRAGDSRR